MKDKNILITGGASGYGYGTARVLKEAGANIWIMGRRLERLKKVAAELNINYIPGDITVSEDWDSAFAIMDNQIDVLINNAGWGVKVEPLTNYSDSEIRQAINTNLTGAILGCRRAAKLMQEKQSGLIINISSICAHYAWPGFACYTAAKAGLDMFSRALYTELRPFNVRVSVVTPSWGATEFNSAANLPANNPELQKRVMTPEQMGELILYICTFPKHLFLPEIMVQPVIQEIIPF